MIKQAELSAWKKAEKEWETLAKGPEVLRYLAEEKALKAGLAALKARRGEGIQDGKWTLSIKTSFSVSYQKLLDALRGRDAVGVAISADLGALKLIQQAKDKDLASGFVSESVEVKVVPAA